MIMTLCAVVFVFIRICVHITKSFFLSMSMLQIVFSMPIQLFNISFCVQVLFYSASGTAILASRVISMIYLCWYGSRVSLSKKADNKITKITVESLWELKWLYLIRLLLRLLHFQQQLYRLQCL